jgi:hypothetical protein
MRIRIGSKVSLFFGLLIGAVVTFMAISGATVFRERMRGKERETWLAIYHAEARRFLATKKEAPRSVEELIEFSKSTGYSIPWAPLQDGYIRYYRLGDDSWTFVSLDRGLGGVAIERFKRGAAYEHWWIKSRPRLRIEKSAEQPLSPD